MPAEWLSTGENGADVGRRTWACALNESMGATGNAGVWATPPGDTSPGDTSWKWGTSWKWVPTFGRNFLEVYDRGVAHTSGKG